MKALNAGILAAIILAPGANAITLQADADAYVRGGGNSGTTNGTFNDLLVANSSVTDDDDFVTYLRFDLSGISGTISNATIMLTESFDFAHTITEYEINVRWLFHSQGDKWDESAITWDNAPGTLPGTTPFLGNWFIPVSAAVGDTHSFSSPSLDFLLNNDLGPDQLATVVLSADQAEHAAFASREHPTLAGPTLTFAVDGQVPVPASLPLAIGALGGMALLANRRRASLSPTRSKA